MSRRRIALIAAACGIDYLLWMLTSATGPEPLALVFGILLTLLLLGLIAAALGALLRGVLSGWPVQREASAVRGPSPAGSDAVQLAPETVQLNAAAARTDRHSANRELRAPGYAIALEAGEGGAAAVLQEAALGRVELSGPAPAGIVEPAAKRVSA